MDWKMWTESLLRDKRLTMTWAGVQNHSLIITHWGTHCTVDYIVRSPFCTAVRMYRENYYTLCSGLIVSHNALWKVVYHRWSLTKRIYHHALHWKKNGPDERRAHPWRRESSATHRTNVSNLPFNFWCWSLFCQILSNIINCEFNVYTLSHYQSWFHSLWPMVVRENHNNAAFPLYASNSTCIQG